MCCHLVIIMQAMPKPDRSGVRVRKAFLLNLMSGLRAFHIVEPLTQILNAFLEVLLYLTLKLRVLVIVL